MLLQDFRRDGESFMLPQYRPDSIFALEPSLVLVIFFCPTPFAFSGVL